MLRLSVILATYNRCDTLPKTLAHLANQDLPKDAYEVIVIDDASPDNTPEVVREIAKTMPYEVTFLRHEENRGAGYTQNRGIRVARAPLLLIMADDILMAPGTLSAHLKSHEEHPEREVSVLGNVIKCPEMMKKSVFLKNFDPFRFKDVDGGVELPYYRFWANNLSVKRDFLRDCGMFIEQKGRAGAHCHHDVLLGYKLHAHGLRLLFNKDAWGYHHEYYTLDGAAKKWRERGLNWGELRAFVPTPELPVAYHVLNLQTVRDHVRTFFSPRRKYLMGADRNPALLLLRHVFRFVAFNGLTARYLWRPLFERAESSPTLARVMNRQFYRLFLYYYFLTGVRDAEPVYGRVPGDDQSIGSGSPRW